MMRCMECNTLMTKEEKVCIECGSAAPSNVHVSGPVNYMFTIVNCMFYGSLASLAASFFMKNGPPMTLSLLLTCALLFLQRTAADGQVKARKH